MKNMAKLFGIIAVALIIFSMAACDGGGTSLDPNQFEGVWVSANPARPALDRNEITFTGSSVNIRKVENGQLIFNKPGTFTFTATEITFIPLEENTWQGYTQGYSFENGGLMLYEAPDDGYFFGFFEKE